MAEVDLMPVDRVDITTLVDNSADMLLPDRGPVRRWGLAGTAGPLPVTRSRASASGHTLDFLTAEHGYSALIEVQQGGGVRRVLYDAGVSPYGLIGNLDRLGIAPDTFEAIVLSHGHFDHVGGLHGLIERITRPNMPVVVHPDVWTRRRLVFTDHEIELPVPSRSALEVAGFTIVENRLPSLLLDDQVLITGEVPRVTDFETGMPPSHQSEVDGKWRHDPLVREDQAAVLHVRDKGLVIVTGCGHAGVVNIVRHAQRLTGVDDVYLVAGGLHLREGPVVAASVAALAEHRPRLVAPGHCTSWVAQQALLAALPGAYRPSAVGSRFELGWDVEEDRP